MNFLQCYEMLGLPPGCTWDELQAGYRRQVQKWHPDRYEQTPDQQSLAAQRMLSINEAFGILAQHYRQFGTLPGEPEPEEASAEMPSAAPDETDAPADTAVPDETVAAAAAPAAYAHASAWNFAPHVEPDQVFPVRRRHDTLSMVPWVVLFGMFGIGYLLLAHLAENGGSEFVDGLRAERPGPALPPPPPGKVFFTRGDTPGRVIEVQGIPTRTSGDLWFYGNSEVYFENGVVASWQSAPGYPLRVSDNGKIAPDDKAPKRP